jgi:hypothetical protein
MGQGESKRTVHRSWRIENKRQLLLWRLFKDECVSRGYYKGMRLRFRGQWVDRRICIYGNSTEFMVCESSVIFDLKKNLFLGYHNFG